MRWTVRNQNGSSELYHYGVLGMKWGVRKDRKSTGRRRKGSIKDVGAQPLKYHSLAAAKARSIAKEVALRIAASIDPTGILMIAYNARVVARTAGANRETFQSNEKYISKDGAFEDLKDIRKKQTTGQSMMDDAKEVNKGSAQGRRNNCMCCVAALEMRQRGYDVQARRRTFGYTSDTYKDLFEGLIINKGSTIRESGESRKSFVNRGYERLTSQLEKYPDGARGFVAFNYEGAKSGHTMSWEVKNGSVTFYDSQQGGTGADRCLSFSNQSYEWGRLDNLKPKSDITELVVSRKEKK